MLSDNWLPKYRLLENFNTKILVFDDVLDFDLQPHPPAWTLGSDVISDKLLPKYRLPENFNTKILVFEDVLDFEL